MEDEQLKEEYVKMYGWEKVEGYRLDMESLNSDYEIYFTPKEDGFVTPCFYWADKEGIDESAYDDIDELIEYIEENEEVSFEAFKQARSK